MGPGPGLGLRKGLGPELSAPGKPPRLLRAEELLERAEEIMLPSYVPPVAAASLSSSTSSESNFPLLPRRVHLPNVENGMQHIISNKVLPIYEFTLRCKMH